MQIKATTLVVAVFMATRTGGATELRSVPNYWCTWATQGATLADNLKAGKIRCPIDAGTQGQRDNLNERVLFDGTGWANVMYPQVRADGLRPFVCGARYPNGAVALAFLPRVLDGRRPTSSWRLRSRRAS